MSKQNWLHRYVCGKYSYSAAQLGVFTQAYGLCTTSFYILYESFQVPGWLASLDYGPHCKSILA